MNSTPTFSRSASGLTPTDASPRAERRARSRDDRPPGPDPLRPPLLSALPIAAFCCDLRGAVASHNDAAAELWGRRPDPLLRGQWSGALAMANPDGSPLARSAFPSALAVAAGRDLPAVDLLVHRPDGSSRRAVSHPKIVRDAEGNVVGAFCSLLDNTESERLAADLRKADDDRNAFLSLLAHELRNPLSPILAAAWSMRKLSVDERVKKMADVVERQTKHLARFVGDLLDASNLAQRGIELKLREADLDGVVDCALDELAPRAAARRQRVEVDFASRRAKVMCDPERVSQALSNILLNASSFTGDEGRIALRVRVDGALLELDVEDTGIGIAAADLCLIFKPYSQFATHAERMRSGVGLGLALAKDICERHGGAVSAHSEGPGRGSRFRIVMPIVVPGHSPGPSVESIDAGPPREVADSAICAI